MICKLCGQPMNRITHSAHSRVEYLCAKCDIVTGYNPPEKGLTLRELEAAMQAELDKRGNPERSRRYCLKLLDGCRLSLERAMMVDTNPPEVLKDAVAIAIGVGLQTIAILAARYGIRLDTAYHKATAFVAEDSPK